MHYINTIIAIILATGMLIAPVSLRAEDLVTKEAVNVSTVAPLSVAIGVPANNMNIETGVATIFTASATGGSPSYGFLWNFGDSTTGAGANFTKTYTTAGSRKVTVTVTDFNQIQMTAEITVNVVTPSTPVSALVTTITSPSNNSSFRVGQSINFSSKATGGSPSYGFLWNFGDSTTGAGANFTKTYTTAGVKTVTLTTTDLSDTQATASIAVTISEDTNGDGEGNTNDPLTISNIRVTDVTYNSAIVRWTTNKAASSRVIYDKVSHASITGQSAPNFGYTNSTGTTDVETKVLEHAVTVTELFPSTTYYFRVLSQ